MSIAASITLTIGLALAKSMIATWTSGASEQVIHDLVDLAGEGARGRFGRKRDEESVEGLAQQVVKDMTTLWQDESRSLDAGAREAVVFALARTLAAGRIDADALIRHRLDGAQLADNLAARSAVQTTGFSPDESAVYRRLLDESCTRIIYIAHHVAGYESTRDRTLLVSLDQLLDATAQLLAGPAAAERAYEDEYRRSLTGPLDKFDAIGISYAENDVRRLTLSDAYVDLRLEADQRSGPIWEMLGQSARLVIRGQPGSGKSTLLRWIAIRAARRELHTVDDRLASWDDAIPFYLRLREFKEGGLPNPSGWPSLLTPMLGLPPPGDWTHRLLKEGRGLVLIDGVDEVAVVQRAGMLAALQSLVNTYPLARYVISSRPAALKNWDEWNDWARKAGFLFATLPEMEIDQINAFVDRWHDALLKVIPDAGEHDKIRPLPAALKQSLRSRLPLRRLARNPLLCTMICALHRERPGNLPENRVKLYQDCVQMLLYERDAAKQVGAVADYPPLTHTHEEVALSEYAHHLLVNAAGEESAGEAQTFFDNLLRTVNMPGWKGSTLCDFLIKRTGLLIEPANEQVAFAHRTFLEYLAARAMVRKNDINLLVKNSGDDQWRETILLTMALAEISEDQSRRLLQGLLEQAAQREGRARQELQLLAVACFESPIWRLEDLRQEVLAQAAALIPPPSDDAVALLAKAGDPLVDLLAYRPGWNDRAMARCVAVLAAIGSDRALNAIAGYSASPAYGAEGEVYLRRAVASAWWSFDPADYCRRVFRHVAIVDLSFTQVSDAGLTHLAALSGLQTLDLSDTQVSDAGLAHLAALSGLQWLDLSNTQVSDAGLAHLAALSGLQWLDLSITRVSDAGLAHLAALSGLQTLGLNRTRVKNHSVLNHLKHLKVYN